MELRNLTADDVLKYMAFYVDVMGPGSGGRQLGLWIRRHGKVKTLGKILEDILQQPGIEPWVVGEILMVLYTVPAIRSYVPVEQLDRYTLDEDPGYKAWVKQLRQELEPNVLNFEDIVERVRKRSGVSGEEVRRILEALFKIMGESLGRGDRIREVVEIGHVIQDEKGLPLVECEPVWE